MKILKRSTKKKSKAKKTIAIAKGRAYDNLYARLQIKEGNKKRNCTDWLGGETDRERSTAREGYKR